MNTSRMTFPMDGSCDPKAVVQGKDYRFTLITDRILRLEYDPEGIFEDRASQTVLRRNFPAPAFTVKDENGRLEIDTALYHLSYEHGISHEFTENTLKIDLKANFTNYGGPWRFRQKTYGDPPRHDNLMGTARTLDRINGATEVEFGLMDKAGRSWFDDSNTALIDADGSLHSRRPGTVDVYYLCCGHDYADALADFYRVSGRPPMLPRYALGNWWSRYWEYSEESYNALVDGFKADDIPFSVAVIDMDWHNTKLDPKYGKGWTGHTWNRDLFPDPERFLKGLHDRGLHTTLNLHPADGVQGYEDAYPAIAKEMGVDAAKEEPVLFDFTDPKFVDAYFEYLMHPHEDIGVDFWWIDWQQGRSTKVPNLDPLWLLNHYHYLDNCRTGKRGMLLSRYGGFGAQRYPVGFSGDTHSTWESLDFQAWFTLTAINSGFPWWSHDIGGFMRGIRDPELFIRWLQFGVFSSFLRLHSSKRIFTTKEPASFGKTAEPVIRQWLQLRHRLIPYIYTEVHRQHTQLKSLIRPLYYDYPNEDQAYNQKNQYFFGSQLMVCPITAPGNESTGMGSVKAWLPAGIHTDLLTGKTYEGKRLVSLHRSVEEYPVLAKPGAIVPTAVHETGSNSTANPAKVEVLVFPGASNSYTLFEDDGETAGFEEGRCFHTQLSLDWENKTFTISGSGDETQLPADRTWQITFRGFDAFEPQGEQVESVRYDARTRSVTVTLKPFAPTETVVLQLTGARRESNVDRVERCRDFLMLVKMGSVEKEEFFKTIAAGQDTATILGGLMADGMDSHLLSCLTELLIN